MKRTLLVLFSVLSLIGGYFILAPIFRDPMRFLIPQRVENLDHARNYYTTISAIFTVIVGVLGVYLGFFYFHLRQRYEKTSYLVKEVGNYSLSVQKVLTLSVANQHELNLTRLSILTSYEIIEAMVQEFRKKEIAEIVRLNSFVDKCDEISRTGFLELQGKDLYTLKDRFSELMKTVRVICHQRL